MKFEEQELKKYEKARKELSLLKYYFAIASILLFLEAFQIKFADKDFNFVPVMIAVFLGLALRMFFFQPDKVVSDLVEKAINQDEESITNLTKLRNKL